MTRVKIDPQYRPFIIKRYRYWTLLLNERQRYLGRAVAWLMRPGEMQRLSGVTAKEMQEFLKIIREYERALDELGFTPDHMNYAMLGNYMHEHAGHGHFHIVPRYKRPVEVMGITFTDDRWGKNWPPETPFAIPRTKLLRLVAMLKKEMK